MWVTIQILNSANAVSWTCCTEKYSNYTNYSRDYWIDHIAHFYLIHPHKWNVFFLFRSNVYWSWEGNWKWLLYTTNIFAIGGMANERTLYRNWNNTSNLRITHVRHAYVTSRWKSRFFALFYSVVFSLQSSPSLWFSFLGENNTFALLGTFSGNDHIALSCITSVGLYWNIT